MSYYETKRIELTNRVNELNKQIEENKEKIRMLQNEESSVIKELLLVQGAIKALDLICLKIHH